MDTPSEPTNQQIAPPSLADPSAGGSRLRDPGGRALAALAWIAIVGVVGVIVFLNNIAVAPEPSPADAEPTPTAGVLELIARYSVGAVDFAGRSSSTPGQADLASTQLFSQLTTIAVTRDDHLRVALIAVEFDNAEQATEQLKQALEADPADAARSADAADAPTPDAPPQSEREATASVPANTGVPEYVEQDAARIRQLLDHGADALSPDDRTALLDHHGWFAQLALTGGLPASDPARIAALRPARRALVALLSVGGLAIAALAAGVVILVTLLLKLSRRRLASHYAPPAPGGSVYLETFALFLVSFLAMKWIADLIFAVSGVDATEWLIWLLPLTLLWPALRGARLAEMKFALGWHRGEGVVKEIGAGIVGYLAGTPVLALGLLTTIVLSAIASRLTGGPSAPPSHPIVQETAVTNIWQIVSLYVLACVWAPITEESIFRGALFHHLRGTLGAVMAALVVGFIFAIIHPQGILLVPPLMALGFVFALIRQWRGSLIASMTAHALHNATLVTLLIVMMS